MKTILFILSVLFISACSKSAEDQHMNAIFDMYGSEIQATPMDGGLTYEFDLKKIPSEMLSSEFVRKVRDKTDSFTGSLPELDDYPSIFEDGTAHGTTSWHTPKYRIVLIDIINYDKGVRKLVYQLVVK